MTWLKAAGAWIKKKLRDAMQAPFMFKRKTIVFIRRTQHKDVMLPTIKWAQLWDFWKMIKHIPEHGAPDDIVF